MTYKVYRGSDFLERKESSKTKNTGLFASSSKNNALSYTSNKGYLFTLDLKVLKKYVIKINCKGLGWNKLFNNLTTDKVIRYYKLKYPETKLIIFENIIDYGGKFNKYVDFESLKRPTTTYCIIDENIIVNKEIKSLIDEK